MGYFRMRRRLEGRPVEATPLPDGITLLPFTRETGYAARELMRRAYDGDLNDCNISFDGWWSWLTGDAEYDYSLMWVAGDGDGKVVGFCHCWRDRFVKDLVVDDAFRRRGLGGALLTRALATFQSRNADYVDLKTDLDNRTAQSLYKRLGFIIVEEVLF